MGKNPVSTFSTAVQVKSSISSRSRALASFTMAGRASMPKPMCRDSSCRMRPHTSPSSGSTAHSCIIRNMETANVSATSCSAMVLMYQRESVRMASKRTRSFSGMG